MARSEFDIRFGYIRWLLHLITGKPVGFAEIGRWVGRTAGTAPVSGQAVSGWAKTKEFPDSRINSRALAVALGVDEGWLIDGDGEPPREDLWPAWRSARARRQLTRKWKPGDFGDADDEAGSRGYASA